LSLGAKIGASQKSDAPLFRLPNSCYYLDVDDLSLFVIELFESTLLRDSFLDAGGVGAADEEDGGGDEEEGLSTFLPDLDQSRHNC
jgi:hypothetical protein